MNAKEMFLEDLEAGKDIEEARRTCGAPTITERARMGSARQAARQHHY